MNLNDPENPAAHGLDPKSIFQVAACGLTGPAGIAACAGVAAGFAAAAGGSIGDALVAAASTLGQIGTWFGVGQLLGDGSGLAFAAVKGAVHGVVGGAISIAQGGNFLEGFATGAIGGAVGNLVAGKGSPLRSIPGGFGKVIRSSLAGAAGGLGARLTGGKFANGFLSAAFAHLYNQERVFARPSAWLGFQARAFLWGDRLAEAYYVKHRADQIQSVYKGEEIADRNNTAGVMLAQSADGLSKYYAAVSGVGKNLSFRQRMTLAPGEINVKGAWPSDAPVDIQHHAEIKLYGYARANDLNILALGTSRRACSACADFLYSKSMVSGF